jgi:hypothetical protein
MDLVGAWLRQLLGAGTAAAIVPVAMLAALAVVLGAAGGFGGLGSLGQLIAGPKVSPTEQAAARQPQGTDGARVAPPTIVASRTPAARKPRRTSRRQGRRAQPPRTRPLARLPPIAAPLVGVARPAPAPPHSLPTSPRPAARPAPKDRTRPVTDLLDRAIGDVRAVVGKVIDRLAQTVGNVIGPPPQDR